MIVAGFDVSVNRLGLGLVQTELRAGRVVLVEMHCAHARIELSRTGWRHDRILQLAQEELLRLDLGRPDAVYIEKPALPRASGTGAAFDAGRALQCVRSAVQILGWPDPELLQPASWKHDAGVDDRKASTYADLLKVTKTPPAGKDAKPDVYLRALDLGFAPEGSQDAADAALVAVAGAIIEHTTREDTP